MISPRSIPGKKQISGRRRGSSVTVFFLFAAPIFLIALVFAFNSAYLAEAKVTLHTSADAAALAAVQSLVDDSWLTHDPALQRNVIASARTQAQAYATVNKVLGSPLDLQLPATANANPPDGDIVFAFLDQPRNPDPTQRVLVVGDLDSTYNGSPFLSQVNTVRINARRFKTRGAPVSLWGANITGIGPIDMMVRATATLDRDVIGFHPQGGQNLPLVPLALLTSSTPVTPNSWENQLQLGNDAWTFDPSTGMFFPGSDQLFEANLLVSGDEAQANATLLLLGISDLMAAGNQTKFDGQIAQGVSAADLQTMGGSFVLSSSNNRLAVSSTRGAAGIYSDLANQLNQIQGQKRIWPLYESFDPATGQAVIAGYVAARVVQANVTANGVALTLQPCMLSTRTALTNAAQRGVGGVNITNPYICKVRLVE